MSVRGRDHALTKGADGGSAVVLRQEPLVNFMAPRDVDTVRAPHDMDDPPTKWRESPRIVVQYAILASNSPNYLGLCALQAGAEAEQATLLTSRLFGQGRH